MLSPNVTNNNLANNRVYSGEGGGIYGDYDASPSMANNIIVYNDSGIRVDKPGWSNLFYNNIFGNRYYDYHNGIVPGDGDISVDPQFVDNTAGNYHLAINSPCINAGNNNFVDNTWVDIDRESRTMGGVVDIGADEYDDVPPVTTIFFDGTNGENGWFVSDVQVILSAEDVGGGIARTEYSWDAGGVWHRYEAPFSATNEGSTIIHYRSVDQAGNVEPYQWKEVKIDRIPPLVNSTVPVGNATNVPVAQTVNVTFSEPIQAGAYYSQITLKKGNDETAIAKSVNGNMLIIDPVANLANRSTYTVTIPTGAIKDAAGNAFVATYAFSFTTVRR